jgi:hypothetical protein
LEVKEITMAMGCQELMSLKPGDKVTVAWEEEAFYGERTLLELDILRLLQEEKGYLVVRGTNEEDRWIGNFSLDCIVMGPFWVERYPKSAWID